MCGDLDRNGDCAQALVERERTGKNEVESADE